MVQDLKDLGSRMAGMGPGSDGLRGRRRTQDHLVVSRIQGELLVANLTNSNFEKYTQEENRTKDLAQEHKILETAKTREAVLRQLRVRCPPLIFSI